MMKIIIEVLLCRVVAVSFPPLLDLGARRLSSRATKKSQRTDELTNFTLTTVRAIN